jgi:FAD/FMN-containing dehydrogenase
VPIGVVVPHGVEDAAAAIAVCREHGAPVVSRGGGTSLAGQLCNVAVVIDWSKYPAEHLVAVPRAPAAVREAAAGVLLRPGEALCDAVEGDPHRDVDRAHEPAPFRAVGRLAAALSSR